MRRLLIDPVAPSETVLAEAAEVIARGGLVAYPTDTLYGLAADPRNPEALDALFVAKGRPADRALPLIAADAGSAAAVARFTPLGLDLARRFWPGPLTIVLDADPSLPPALHGGTGRVAIRVPDHPVARLLARLAGGAIVSTSANRSGEPATADPGEVAATMGGWIDLLIDGGPAPGGLPSTIVEATGGAPALLRDGAVPWARVLESRTR